MSKSGLIAFGLCLVLPWTVARADEEAWVGESRSRFWFDVRGGSGDERTVSLAEVLENGDPKFGRETSDSDSRPARISSLGSQGAEASVFQVGVIAKVDSPDQTWVLIAPYVWTPAMKGTVGARGVSVPIDMSLSDLYQILFQDLNGAFMGHAEVGKGDFGLILDGMLMSIGPTEPGPLGGKVKFDISSTILESLVMARIVNVPTSVSDTSRFAFDLLAGARYYQVNNGFRINPVIGPNVQVDLSKDWVDLVFGARTATTVLPGVDGFLRGDVAGFGIGTSSTLTWNIQGGVSLDCPNHPGTSLVLGYRVFDINETQQSGPQQFKFDVLMHGPFAALTFAF